MAVRTSFTAGEVLAAADLTDTFGSKVDYALPVDAESGTTYTFTLANAKQLVTATNASAKTFTIPPQSSVTWLANSVIRVVNYGAGALTVNGGVGVTVTNTAATLTQFQSAAAFRTGSDAWTLVPFAGGAVSNANFSDAATGTYTDSGIDYKFITYNSSGTLTITTAGVVTALIVAGGGGSGGTNNSGAGGGGGGGYMELENLQLATGTYTVTIGAGGAAGGFGANGANGSNSLIRLSPFGRVSLGGGGGGGKNLAGGNGGSGGGGGTNSGAGGTSFQGFDGTIGGASAAFAGGGGGAGGLGSTTTGGVGSASTITGASVTRAKGGNGSLATVAGGANTGDGAGGNSSGGTIVGAAGGSGVVIIRVRTN